MPRHSADGPERTRGGPDDGAAVRVGGVGL